eukprot:4372000-Pleurochrysis_carterae.AAC.1
MLGDAIAAFILAVPECACPCQRRGSRWITAHCMHVPLQFVSRQPEQSASDQQQEVRPPRTAGCQLAVRAEGAAPVP